MSNTIVEANKILLRRKNKLIVGNVGYVMSDDTQRYLVRFRPLIVRLIII